ncbi:hypothetical protein FEM48_Zijuj03G0157500 [Ziziphus jujuba var. spinosa]|uniref:Uncharacterized protein n=1 Tax=Ziziphus jujuba var. spinosa TaxID=714518 RepID=A0A978VR69_ZIZJJ|nr:hypothetical protein FEM48_Zijuj03G0157500 [Ziziphus jujuba var. spinosa]
MAVTKLAGVVELKVNEYNGSRKKNKSNLENSVVSLTKENRSIDSLLMIALVEMEAMDKSLSRLKGNKSSGTKVDTPRANAGTKLDSSESEEEASTVERITKNLNLEITQLRRSLEESRSSTEHLQSLTEKQAQDFAENMLYIKELEDREKKLAQNVVILVAKKCYGCLPCIIPSFYECKVEELLLKIKQTEAEVARWKEACELDVEAGKREIEERDKVQIKTILDISNRKLNEKEELAAVAMAAKAAAEKSLQLADSTAAELRKRVEEQSKQLGEAEIRDQSRCKARHICWPRQALKPSTACMNNRVKNVKRILPNCKKDAVKPSIATINNKVKNLRRILSKCKT